MKQIIQNEKHGSKCDRHLGFIGVPVALYDKMSYNVEKQKREGG